MKDVNPAGASPLETVSYRLGVLGAIATDTLSARIETIGLKPKHAGVLTALDALGPLSQQELARTMRVAPSLVVLLADELEKLDAIQRVRDPNDRRRQLLSMTPAGRKLLVEVTEMARDIDAEFLAALPTDEHQGLDAALRTLAANHLTGPR